MLQFITRKSKKYTIAEEVQMVIDGGCRWVQLNMPGATDAEVRDVANEVIPMCQETDTFLIIAGRVELVNDLKVSGVHLGSDDMSPSEARELLGPHAVVGVSVHDASQILALQGLDIDYVDLGPVNRCVCTTCSAMGYDAVAEVIDTVRKANMIIPVVATGGITLNDVQPLLDAGVNGVAVGYDIINAEDPEARTAQFLNRLGIFPA